MEINWSTAGWIAAIVVLYLFGYYEGRAAGYKRRKKEEQKEKEAQPPPQPEKVTETVTVTVDDPGLLRIKNEGGAYTLDLDGSRVNPTSLPSEQRRRLIELLNVMRPWLEGRPAPAPTATASAAPPPPSPPPATPRPASFQPASSAPLGSAQPAGPAPSASQPPAGSKPAASAKENRPSAPAGSIVTQIDSVLQARLAGTPLEERGIFLTESPQGGVSVYVGLTRYDGVEDVPDPEVKAAIRAAITEWENKYTPGL